MTFDEDGFIFVKLNGEDGQYITVSKITEVSPGEWVWDEGSEIVYYHPDSNEGDSTSLTYNDIINSRAFYLWEVFDGIGTESPPSPYNLDFLPRGAILVKGENLNEGQLIYNFTPFAQSIGTIYVPQRLTYATTKQVFKREFLMNTEEVLEYDWVPALFDISHRSITIVLNANGVTSITFPEEVLPFVEGEPLPNLHLRFFKEAEDIGSGEWTEVFIEYAFTSLTQEYILHLRYSPIFNGTPIMIRYLLPESPTIPE